jgi:hypothetical protein
MGCSSCSTATSTGSPAGCRNNGTCGTGGCNKLNVYNWLADMYLPEGQKPFDIVEVRFKGSRKSFTGISITSIYMSGRWWQLKEIPVMISGK